MKSICLAGEGYSLDAVRIRICVLLFLVPVVTFPPKLVLGRALQSEPPKPQESIRIKVVDKDGDPIEEARIEVGVTSDVRTTLAPYRIFATGKDGASQVELPKTMNMLRIWVYADAKVPMYMNWEEKDFKSGNRPPSEFVFHMENGQQAGGFIKDENGNPIAAAEIDVVVDCKSNPHVSGKNPGFVLRLKNLKSDENGFWSTNSIPLRSDVKLKASIYHPNYISDSDYSSDVQRSSRVTTQEMLAQGAIFSLKRGVALTGKITDSADQPIQDAVVVYGEYWRSRKGTDQIVQVGDNGLFEIESLEAKETRLTFIAPGYQPETMLVDVDPMMDPIEVALEKGRELVARVVNETGEPVAADFRVSYWRNQTTLFNHHPTIDSGIPSSTDNNGLYIWTGAPEDHVNFAIVAKGYLSKDVRLRAGDTPKVITLRPPFQLEGTVVDKKTGRPIPKFQITSSVFVPRKTGGQRESKFRRTGHQNGEFQVDFTRIDAPYLVEVHAPGYSAFRSEVFQAGNENTPLNVELVPQAVGTGRVADKRGQSVPDAQIAICNHETRVKARSYLFSDRQELIDVSESGDFTIPAQDTSYTIVVISDEGYAEIVKQPGESPGDIVLKPWATIEGTVLNDLGLPASDINVAFEGIRFEHGKYYYVQDMTMVKTDESGHYRFDRVPPIPINVRPLGHMTEQLDSSSHRPLHPEPGQKLTGIDFGKGAAVTAQLDLSGVETFNGDYSKVQIITLPVNSPELPLPKNLNVGPLDWAHPASVFEKIREQPDRQKIRPFDYSLRMQRTWVDADGKVKIMIDQSGHYEMLIKGYVRNPENEAGVMGSPAVTKTVRVSVSSKAVTDESVIELGHVKMPDKKLHPVNQTLPNFTYLNEKKETVLSESWSDRTVVIEFFAPWCRACESATPKVLKLAAVCEEKDGLHLLSIHGGGTGFVERKPGEATSWSYGELPEDDHQKILSKMGIWYFPRYMVVEDGKLIYQGGINGVSEFISTYR